MQGHEFLPKTSSSVRIRFPCFNMLGTWAGDMVRPVKPSLEMPASYIRAWFESQLLYIRSSFQLMHLEGQRYLGPCYPCGREVEFLFSASGQSPHSYGSHLAGGSCNSISLSLSLSLPHPLIPTCASSPLLLCL